MTATLRAFKIRPMLAVVIPLPTELTTPPVTKMNLGNFVLDLIISGNYFTSYCVEKLKLIDFVEMLTIDRISSYSYLHKFTSLTLCNLLRSSY